MLNKKQLAAFGNATSVGVHTMVSVPYMLTGLQGSDPNGAVYRTPTIFDYAVSRGYNTAFLSAQDMRWGDLGQFVGNSGVEHFLSGPQFNPNVSVHKGADDMLVLEKGVKPFLQEHPDPFFWLCKWMAVIIHMPNICRTFAEHMPNIRRTYAEHMPNICRTFARRV